MFAACSNQGNEIGLRMMINHSVAMFSAVLLHYWMMMRVKIVFALLCESGEGGLCVCVCVWEMCHFLPSYQLSVCFEQTCTNVYLNLKFCSMSVCIEHVLCGWAYVLVCRGLLILCLLFHLFFFLLYLLAPGWWSTSLISFLACFFWFEPVRVLCVWLCISLGVSRV